jgi:hypothetical protein
MVLVVQADNRLTLDYLALSRGANQLQCRRLGYDYAFVDMNDLKYSTLFVHPATAKIHIVRDMLQQRRDARVIVFLDTDAWIQNGRVLNSMIESLQANEQKHGLFSRDPYMKGNTYVNSGSFVLKNDKYTRCMYRELVRTLEANPAHTFKWPFDQYYVSNFVFDHKEWFEIYAPDVLNTPHGKVLRHNWLKNEDMIEDLKRLLNDRTNDDIDVELTLDDRPFPNE